METTPLSAGQVVANLAGQLVRLDDLIAAMGNLETQIHGCAVAIGFVFLVLGTMQGFFSGLPHKFFYQIVRSLILVALICGWNSVDNTIGSAVKSFRNYPVRVTLKGSNQSIGPGPLDVSTLELMISEKLGRDVSEVTSSQSQKPVNIPLLGNAINEVLTAIHRATHLVDLVLYGIFLFLVVLCQLIIRLMEFLQQAILVLFRFYVPIGLSFHSSPSLNSLGHGFFKNYFGVQCWPVGWAFVNLVTFALVSQLSAPNPDDIGSLLLAIAAFIPIVLWVLLGHLIGPFYAQKIITHGGQALQGMIGGIVAASGAAFAKGADMLSSGAMAGAALASGNPVLVPGATKRSGSRFERSTKNGLENTTNSDSAWSTQPTADSAYKQSRNCASTEGYPNIANFATGVALMGGLSLLTAARVAGGLVQGVGTLTSNAGGDSAQVDVALVRHAGSGLSSNHSFNRSSQRARQYVQSAPSSAINDQDPSPPESSDV
jgi:hypothetical protein